MRHEPINEIKNKRLRNAIIIRDFGRLLADLRDAGSPPIVLVKKNVHETLYSRLHTLGFSVLNTQPIPFPMHWHQRRFAECFTPLLGLIAQN
jgi:hypothetical protein